MSKSNRYFIPGLILLLGLAALACGTLTGSGSSSSGDGIDQDAIIEAAVATVQAQQPTIFSPTEGQGVALIDSDLQETLITLYNSINPSVVHVFSTQGTGSGFIYDTEGHIITNNHVIAGSQQFRQTGLAVGVIAGQHRCVAIRGETQRAGQGTTNLLKLRRDGVGFAS